jgi:hypothetical protein
VGNTVRGIGHEARGIHREWGRDLGSQTIRATQKQLGVLAIFGSAGTAMKTCEYPVRFLARAHSTPLKLRQLAEQFTADAIDPLWYTCQSCKLTWDCSPLDDYREVVCSNCYSENVLLVGVRLGFANWGKQNGGVKHMMDRFRKALAQGAGQRAAAGKESDLISRCVGVG